MEYIKCIDLSPEDITQYRTKFFLHTFIRAHSGWTGKPIKLSFQGNDYFLMPRDGDFLAYISIEIGRREDPKNKQSSVAMLASYLAWYFKQGIEICTWIGHAGLISKFKYGNIPVIYSHFDVRYIPRIPDDKAKIALALYREALTLNVNGYKFLSFYKVLDLACNTSHNQRQAIKEYLPKIIDREAKARIETLYQSNENIEEYLYKSCRCAVAHAYQKPFLNPDNIDDDVRLKADLPIIKEIAEKIIEDKFGIMTSESYREKHLYETMGFEEMQSEDVLSMICGDHTHDIKEVMLPKLFSIRIRNKPEYQALSSLTILNKSLNGSCLLLLLSNSTRHISIKMEIDFKSHTLAMDPLKDIQLAYSGDTRIDDVNVSCLDFIIDMAHNNVMEIWDPEKPAILGYKEPYIPVMHSFKNPIDMLMDVKEKWTSGTLKQPCKIVFR